MAVYAGFNNAADDEDDDEDEGLRAGISIDQALATALGSVNGFAMHAETEREKQAVNWCVVIVAPDGKIHEVEMNGTTGAVIESEEGDDEGPALTAQTTMAAAVSTARNAKPGYVTEAELENEDGTLTWGVEVIAADGKLWEVEMNANTGAVTSVALEDDDGN
jgi:uncharacterized membrane protein YkoI